MGRFLKGTAPDWFGVILSIVVIFIAVFSIGTRTAEGFLEEDCSLIQKSQFSTLVDIVKLRESSGSQNVEEIIEVRECIEYIRADEEKLVYKFKGKSEEEAIKYGVTFQIPMDKYPEGKITKAGKYNVRVSTEPLRVVFQ